MSSFAAYGRLEKGIAATDRGSIQQRWEYGRRLLCDPAATTEAGNLRNGVIAGLIEAAHKAGIKISEREIQYRLQAGKAYPCKSQITHICASYDSWGALRGADFPEAEADPGDEPFDPRTTAEKVRQTEKQLSLGEPDQLVLFEYFPSESFSELSTVAELRKYAAGMSEWTERQARADAKRIAYVEALSHAVGGDESKSWAEAQAALDAGKQEEASG